MVYTQDEVQEAQKVRAELLSAFKNVDLGYKRHVSIASFGPDWLNEEQEDIEKIISLVHESTGIDKVIVERFYYSGPKASGYDINIDETHEQPRSIRQGYKKKISDEEMCEILGYTPSIKKQSFLSALLFGERKN